MANEIDGEVDAGAASAELDRLEALVTGDGAPERNRCPPGRPRLACCRPASQRRRTISCGPRRTVPHRGRRHLPGRAGAAFQLGAAPDPTALYRALRTVNPSPYMVLFRGARGGARRRHPEMLVRKSGRRIETRPIAGTRGAVRPRKTTAGPRASGRRQGARRTRHAGRSRAQRSRPGRGARIGARAEFHGGGALQSRDAHLFDRGRGAGGGQDGAHPALACFPAGTVSGPPRSAPWN